MSDDRAIEALRLEIGSNFEAWAQKMEHAFNERTSDHAWPDHVSRPDRPTGWDDAGVWLNAVYSMMWTSPRQTELELFLACSELAEKAWKESVKRLVDKLLELGVLDPHFYDIESDGVIEDQLARRQVLEDEDDDLLQEFERLRRSRSISGIKGASGAVEEIALNLAGVADGVLAAYVVAALHRLRVSAKPALTFQLTSDEAESFAKRYASNLSTDNLILVSQERTTTYERPSRRVWRREHTTWTHTFVGPDLEYTIVLEMQPEQEIPRLVMASTKTSPRDRYNDLATTGRHRWIPDRPARDSG
ncbi:hypothetical protein [Jatrophihabitans sp.]|uniref:hypothetical protein n=1 Tax=Jatrophihabitans sp. TaxID=1932789 RepID=UPI002CBDC22B|nr:hypothetical protein [Jatrophihabitans sp.]